MKIISIGLLLLGICYPFIIYFSDKYLWLFFLLFSLLWLIKFTALNIKGNKENLDCKNRNEFVKIFQSYSYFLNNKYISFLFFILFFCMFIIKFNAIWYDLLIYIYPLLIYIMFFAVFINNIKTKPLIEYFAEIEHKIRHLPQLNEKEKRYTKKLTYIWSGFFLLNALICLILSLIEDKTYWFFYTGVAGYALTGILFISERIFRNKIMKLMK